MKKIRIGNGIWYEGDCLEVMRKFKPNYFNMVLCDLPYGTTQNKWDSLIPFVDLWGCYDFLCKGAVCLFAQTPFDKALGMSNIHNLKYEWIWEKTKATGHLNVKKAPLKAHENILVFYKKPPTYNPQMTAGEPYAARGGKNRSTNYGKFTSKRSDNVTGLRYPRDVQIFNYESNPIHPTQKPVPLFEYLIKTYTNPGDIILDNCAGSGTTAIAAENTGRRWVCIEKDPEYSRKALERIRNHLDEKDRHSRRT